MKVSLNWLRDYVQISIDLEDLVHLLTMAGLEVEGVTSTGEGFDRVVVAEILSVRRHPNADRLSLVEVTTGNAKYSIVCGATNIRAGQRVPLALVGARLPNGVQIKKSKIRGEISEGMLCSEIELGLGEDAKGILILSPESPLGVDLGEALGLKDAVLDISVTPNRPDCLSVIGIAREIAALTHQKLKYPDTSIEEEAEEIHRRTSVTILDPELCPRYVARMIEGVKVGPSPSWLKNRLEKVGLRSISNVVDVTNYVMLEYGQPLHAFDFTFLEEGRIVVRRAKEGEHFTTLDGVERVLDDQMLMICDGVKAVAIAGVMGGLNSEIRDETTTVLLESAYFDPASNRRTSKKLGLETEASYRFGRGIDYGGCLTAANRAARLIQQLAGGRIVEGAVDAYPRPLHPRPIRLSVEKTNRILGTEIPSESMKTYLEDLEVKVQKEDEDTFVVVPPSFRGDLEREIDLVEEIARLDGYDRIPVTLPRGEPSSEPRPRELSLEQEAMEVLLHYGYHEVITYSFSSPDVLDRIKLPAEDFRRRQVRILNPLTEDFSVLRTSLIPGLLETARYNFSRKNLNLKLFELKRVFLPSEGERLPNEPKFLAGLATGFEGEPHWASSQRAVDFYDVKGLVEDLLEALQIQEVIFRRTREVPYLHPGKATEVLSGGVRLGVFGEAHPEVLAAYELDGRVFLFDFDFEKMVEKATVTKRFRPLPKFPAVYRDLSLIVDEAIEVESLAEAIRTSREPFIDQIVLFDLYHGAPIPAGKKGVSYRIRYQAADRTLTDDEVNRSHEQIILRLKEMFQAQLR
jgi:phenylalanyl-tRNA synthetase beta chain